MKRVIVISIMLFLCVAMFGKKEAIDPQKVIYVDFQYNGQGGDTEVSVRKALANKVIAPYYLEHNCIEANPKKDPVDLIVSVTTSNFKYNVLNYTEALSVGIISVTTGDKKWPGVIYISFDYTITYSFPDVGLVHHLEGSYSTLYNYTDSFTRLPDFEIPELGSFAIRSLVPNKQIPMTEISDMRLTGTGIVLTEGKKPSYNYLLDVSTSGLKGDYLNYVKNDINDTFGKNLKKKMKRTSIYEEADMFVYITMLNFNEQKGRKTLKLTNKEGQEYDKTVDIENLLVDYQVDIYIPTGWVSSQPSLVYSTRGSASDWDILPIINKHIIRTFPEIDNSIYQTFAELGHLNRSTRNLSNPNNNLFQWTGKIAEGIPYDAVAGSDVKTTQSESSKSNEAQIIDNISTLAQQYLNDDFLAPRTPVDIAPLIPPKIALSTLPPLPNLVKDQFETTQQFEARVLEATENRQRAVEVTQKNYAESVQKRNKIVDNLDEFNKSQIVMIMEEQKIKKQNLPVVFPELVYKAFTKVLGPAQIVNLQYDADSETMHGIIYSSLANYSIGFNQTMPVKIAKSYIQGKDMVFPILVYKVLFDVADNSISNQQLQLMEVKTIFDGKVYPAQLSKEAFQPKQISFQIQEKKVEVSSAKQFDLSLQNPLLPDRISVESIRIRDKSLNPKDDLADLIARVSQAPEDDKKWLFMVGIENYQEADQIDFSLSSTTAFEQAASKILGIKKSHVISLMDENATSQRIKDKLGDMLSRVNEGDIVYFYYSGHGMPSKDSSQDQEMEYETYLLPVDAMPGYIFKTPEMKMVSIYKQLTDSKAAKVVCFIDACFSGKSEYGTLTPKGDLAAGLLLTKQESYNKNKMVLLSATQQGQAACSYPQKGNRLFSYFLIKGLLDTAGDNPTAQELFAQYSEKVRSISYDRGDTYRQDPQITGKTDLKIK